MARLQILELPEGAGDDRPPFALVIDEYTSQRYILGPGQSTDPAPEGMAESIGARAVLAFAETIDIPANDLTGYNGIPGGDYTAFAATVSRAIGIDTSTPTPDVAGWLLTACHELEKSETARKQLHQQHAPLTNALERVRHLHRPVEHQGQSICWECSAYDPDDQTTYLPPAAYDQCSTLRALNDPPTPSTEQT
ncbi:hypothetical protein [Streptomyces uncialis]|uniref:hypothetical protein n=1 Tax=Streptomyces uncialis TaxID=1048205 RepID=UPI00093931F5|nr:hypothetical protein [Streptomyces uncialis]